MDEAEVRSGELASRGATDELASRRCTLRLGLAYRGSGFRGFAANEGVRTVAGELAGALERILGVAPVLSVAGRTDAGVHAVGQVVSFEVGGEALRRVASGRSPEDRPLERLAASLNRILSPEIVVTGAAFAPSGFDARHSAIGRAYEYVIRNGVHLDPRSAEVEWHVATPLDVAQMNAAAAQVVGSHDFASFCRRPKSRDADQPEASLVRTVTRATWSAQPAEPTALGGATRLLFDIEANAFCHQMVRSIVGHCVAVGRGDRAAEDVPSVLAARSRDAAAPVAPPHGLTLMAVRYP